VVVVEHRGGNRDGGGRSLQVLSAGQADVTAVYQGATGRFFVSATPFVLTPSTPLTVTFTTFPNTADLLTFFTNALVSYSAPSVLTAQLFNGSTLLGTFSQSRSGVSGFTFAYLSPTSPSTYFGPTGFSRVDFSALNGGTSSGRIVLSIAGGSASNIDTNLVNCPTALQCPRVYLGHSQNDPAGFSADLSELRVTGASTGAP
jgi:hypothetical protein